MRESESGRARTHVEKALELRAAVHVEDGLQVVHLAVVARLARRGRGRRGGRRERRQGGGCGTPHPLLAGHLLLGLVLEVSQQVVQTHRWCGEAIIFVCNACTSIFASPHHSITALSTEQTQQQHGELWSTTNTGEDTTRDEQERKQRGKEGKKEIGREGEKERRRERRKEGKGLFIRARHTHCRWKKRSVHFGKSLTLTPFDIASAMTSCCVAVNVTPSAKRFVFISVT